MISISRYRIRFDFESPVDIPAPAGLLWHSLLGNAVRQNVCLYPGADCAKCYLRDNCDYSVVFRPLRPERDASSQQPPIPVPHLFQIDGAMKTSGPQRVAECTIALVGQSRQRLAAIMRGSYRLGANGVGKKEARVPAQVSGISRLTLGGQTIELLQGHTDPFCQDPVADSVVVPHKPEQMVLEMLTPYRPPGGRSIRARDFDLCAFLMAIVRRVSLLNRYHEPEPITADYKALKQCAESALASVNLSDHKTEYYSAAHRRVEDHSGVVGTIALDESTADVFWPYIHTGQYLNVGKYASKGLGQYRLQTS